jgi:cephalosporin-C deacetylase
MCRTTTTGHGGTPVRGWLHVPAGVTDPLPTVVEYHGYSRGRGYAHFSTIWAHAG